MPARKIALTVPRYENYRPRSAEASRVGTGNRRQDTTPEILLRAALRAAGVRYRFNVKTLPGCPDLVIARHGRCGFCDGDFWHGRHWSKQEKQAGGRMECGILGRKDRTESSTRPAGDACFCESSVGPSFEFGKATCGAIHSGPRARFYDAIQASILTRASIQSSANHRRKRGGILELRSSSMTSPSPSNVLTLDVPKLPTSGLAQFTSRELVPIQRRRAVALVVAELSICRPDGTPASCKPTSPTQRVGRNATCASVHRHRGSGQSRSKCSG